MHKAIIVRLLLAAVQKLVGVVTLLVAVVLAHIGIDDVRTVAKGI